MLRSVPNTARLPLRKMQSPLDESDDQYRILVGNLTVGLLIDNIPTFEKKRS